MKRRDFLKTGLLSGAGFALAGLNPLTTRRAEAAVTPFTIPLNIPPVLSPTTSTSTADFYDLQIREAYAEIIPGLQTRIIGFNGMTPGPTIRARAGRQTVMSHYNGLPPTTLWNTPGNCTIHLHGGHIPASEDGYPTDYIRPGITRSYSYPNNQLPTTLWYHDHCMDFTGPHVWYGMAGFYLLSDDYEDSLGLPSGAYEVPLVIQDRNFDANGQLVYTRNRMQGETGNTILVNGTIQPYFNVATRRYRLRVLNGSNARFYRLALSNGASFQVLGMEGGLLPRPVTVTSLTLAPAERADIVIDFGSLAVGTTIELRNTLVGSTSSVYKIMRFDVTRSEADPSKVPANLRALTKLNPAQAVTTRNFTISMMMGGGMGGMGSGPMWVINGLGFDPNRIDAQPKLGTTEIWRFTNRSGMAHPIHMHDVMFQILDINGAAPAATHAGWKDTVVVPAMGNARVIARFEDYTGLYMFHCHMLEHEDYMAMAQFKVVV
jgi:spore coat protein A